ncbi:kelch-like protein 38 [Ptychodera flava]|uniref:kelch-like protein 38 n=1 Tax=Ptychodera flava TaxID=63121 RepID=UPI003969F7D9
MNDCTMSSGTEDKTSKSYDSLLKLMREMNRLRQTSTFTDVCLYADRVAFPCHRVVLASASPYFRTMFSGEFVESREGHGVTIHGVSPSSLESVLEYVYTGTTQITNDNVETILSAASLFLLDDLEHRCVEHLEENLYFDNCIRVLKLSSAYSTSCSVLRKTAWVYAVHNLPEVMKSDDFVNLSEDELHQYLREARLYIDPHVPLFEAILKWWRFDGSRSLPRALSIAGISIELATSQIPNDELSALIQETAGDQVIRRTSSHR